MVLGAGLMIASRPVRAQVNTDAEPISAPPEAQVLALEGERKKPEYSDRTGGAYSSPTLFFTPAAAVPVWRARVLLGSDFQPNAQSQDKARPHGAAELGLPYGFTFGLGSRWVGGDQGSGADGLTPFAQIRYQILGSTTGRGALLGASMTYKQVGFGGDKPELETSVAFQYRAKVIELGIAGVFGQGIEETEEHDLEAKLYVAARPLEWLAVGVSGQVRGEMESEEAEREKRLVSIGTLAQNQPEKREFDYVVGGLASATFGQWQIASLVGGSTLGMRTDPSLLVQVFGGVMF